MIPTPFFQIALLALTISVVYGGDLDGHEILSGHGGDLGEHGGDIGGHGGGYEEVGLRSPWMEDDRLDVMAKYRTESP